MKTTGRLVIIGAGDFGREVLDWALDIPPENREWDRICFLDSNLLALDGYALQYPILGDPATYNPSTDDVFLCAIGDPRIKLTLCREIIKRGGKFTTLIHPSAVVGSNNKIGEGTIICPGVILTRDIVLGKFVIINIHATVGHNAVLGDGCTLSPHCDVTGRAHLGEGVFLGSHASILPSVVVNDYAVVGAGSVVLRPVPPGVTVVGVPAKQVGGVHSKEK